MSVTKVQLSVEENIMRKAMLHYTHNNIAREIDLSQYHYDPNKLLAVIKKCKNAGIVNRLIHKTKEIINVPESLEDAISAMYNDSLKRSDEAAAIVKQVMALTRNNNIRCVVGGSYVIMKQICGYGELFIDELLFYCDRMPDLSGLSNIIACKYILENIDFFAENYSPCLLINEAPLEIVYSTLLSEITDNKALNDKAIQSYLLHMEYYDRYNFVGQSKKQYQNEIIDNLFAVNIK